MGLTARVLAGDIFEEVAFRWGLMSLIAWLGSKLFRSTTDPVIWGSILLAASASALAHIPGAAAIGIQPTPALVTMSLVINLLAGTLFGWLFWQYGLLAAMIAHALFPVVWFPFEKRWVGTGEEPD
ncbi:MAG TPA: CPBP family glutamic-type intramembrane protease [Anaerolineales bacterium]